MAYAGHQFGHFVPQLGDGRAILLGEVIDADGSPPRHPAQGLGPTPFSRRRRRPRGAGPGAARIHRQRGDGRAGHPDHASARRRDHRRAGDARDRAARRGADPRGRQPHPRRHVPVLRRARRHRGRAAAGRPRRSPATTRTRRAPRTPIAPCSSGVIARQAELVAHWMLVGFIHGVMNTDNTVDLRRDHRLRPVRLHGRLRPGHGVQLDRPGAATPTPTSPDRASGTWRGWPRPAAAARRRHRTRRSASARKRSAPSAGGSSAAYSAGCGERSACHDGAEGDDGLVQDLLAPMAENAADFTLTFRRLCDAAAGPEDDERADVVRRSRRL